MRIYTGLVHYPVYNKNKEKIISCITTLDIHDMARLARTYDINNLYIITPAEQQQDLAARIIEHWTNGYGSKYNPDRKKAIELVKIMPYLEDAVEDIKKTEKSRPLLIATDANKHKNKAITFEKMRLLIEKGAVVFLLFGTAWGLHADVINRVDYVLEPIYGRTNYRHLSVRAAAAIITDRLMREVKNG